MLVGGFGDAGVPFELLHALLEQVPGLHALGRDRLYEAGMTSLALYFVAKAKDLVETARIEPRWRRSFDAAVVRREVSDAFVAGRLTGEGLTFGTLPPGLDFAAIIDRARAAA
mgnify:CR=1 FL=1